MKTLTKKLLFTVFAAFLALSCLYFAGVAFNKQVAEADEVALEAEFTDNGEFSIGASSVFPSTFSFIDGATVGGDGAVLQVNRESVNGVNTFRLDLTPMAVAKADIVSIVVRLKADNFTLGKDEFRTYASGWNNYGTNVDLSDWYEYTLNAASMNQFTTNDNGTIGYLDIGIRSKTTSLILYVDSITVKTVADFTNNGEFEIKTSTSYSSTFSFIDGTTVGGTGVVLQVNQSGGINLFKLDLTPMAINAEDDVKIAVRLKAANFTLGQDEFRTYKGTSSVNYGKTDDLSDWFEYTLNANSMNQFTTNDNGTLKDIDIGIRSYTASLIMYVDSITITNATALEAEFTNNGEFSIGTSVFASAYSFINGTSVGGTGAVLQVNRNADANAFRLDLTSMKITKADIASIVVKVKADNFTKGTDEFRTYASGWTYYGKTDDLSDWFEYTLSAASMNQFTTNGDGTIGYLDIGIRSYTTSLIMYVDSITITTTLEEEFTNDGEFEIKTALFPSTYSFINGTAIGATDAGAVLQVNRENTNGVNVFRLDLTPMAIDVGDIVNIVVKVKADNFTLGQDEFRTRASGWVNYGTDVDLSDWYEYTLNAASMNQFTINGDGTLGYLDIGIRSKTTSLIMYVDSITVSVTERDTSAMEMQNFDSVFPNASFNSLTCALLTYSGTATWDDSDDGNLKYKMTLKNSSTGETVLYANSGSSITHFSGQKWANVALPGTYDTIIIAEGAHFAGVKIPAMTLVFDTEWKFTEKYDDLNFVGIHSSYNNDSNGYFIFKFDTNAWTNQETPTNMTGFHYNGNALSDLTASVLFYKTSSLWLQYTPQTSNAKLVANYNGYSHPTIEIEEGASFEYGGHTYTFHAITFYLVDGQWQIAVPDGYYDHIEEAEFTGVWGSPNQFNSSTQLLLQYSATTWDYTDKGDLASKITYRNSSTSASYSATSDDISGANGQKWIILSGLTGYDVIEIASGGTFGGVMIPAGTFYLVNGHWTTGAPHAADTVFTDFSSSINNNSSNGLSQTALKFNVNPLGAASSHNLQATPNRTSLMIKYNGSTFFDLFYNTANANHAKYTISYSQSSNYFMFSIPEDDLVDGATLVIEDGTPFMDYYLAGITITYDATSGKWVNYNPSFVSIDSNFNNESHGYLIIQFNTTVWTHQTAPTSKSGITYNGNNITDLTSNILFFGTSSIWFAYTPQESNSKLAANYNGYSHPTIEFAEGATMSYDGHTYTFHATTLYLNLSTNKWQTEIPDGYTIRSVVSYSSVNASYNNNQTAASGYSCTLIQFSGTIGSYTGTNLASTLGANITVGGSALSSISGAVVQIGYNGECTDSLWIKVPLSALVIDDTSKVVELTISAYILGDVVINATALHLVDGAWVASYSATIRTYVNEHWKCHDHTDGVLTANIGSDKVFALFDYNVFMNDGGYTVYNNYITSTNDVGNKIKVNGTTPLKDVDGARVYLVNGQLLVAVPSCEYITVEEGTYFLGQLLGATTIYYTGGTWETSEPTPTAVTFSDMQWNNLDYNAYSVDLGYENNSGVPANGMVALLNFSDNLSVLVSGQTRTSWANQVGAYSKVGNGIKINNIPLKDVEGAYVGYMLGGTKLYMYIPFAGLTSSAVYTLTIEAGTKILNASLPALTYYFYDRQWNTEAPELLTIVYDDASFSTNIRIGNSINVNADYLTDVLSNKLDNVIVLGWTIGATDYFYGDSTSISGTTTVTITNIVNFYTLRGAYLRITDDGNTGLRFESRIGNEDLAALIEAYDSVELGTYIAPKALLDAYLTANSSSTFKDYFAQAQGSGTDTKYLNIVNKNASGEIGIYNRATYETDGYIRYFGSIVNIYEVNYYNKFIGVGYLKLVKGANTYVVYGTTNLAYTTKTIYDIAKTAYNDTTKYDDNAPELDIIKGYMDAVADLTFKHGNLNVNEVITERDYTSPYQTDSDGVNYYIARGGSTDVPKTIIINGKKISSSNFSINDVSGSLVMNIDVNSLAALFTDGVVYGVGEPDNVLWNEGNDIAQADMLSDITGALGATAFRIWMGGNVASVSSSNVVSLTPAQMTELYNLISGLVNNGVKEIYLTGQHFQLMDYPMIYVSSEVGWKSYNEYNENYRSTVPLKIDTAAVPDPGTEAEAYAKWLKIQYDYYNLLTAQIATWQAANSSWDDVKFYFESLNEPEGQSNIHQRGNYTSQYIAKYFTTADLAKILTDVAYYMTVAVNANLDGTGFVTTPALTFITGNSGRSSGTGVYADGLLLNMANAIKDNVAPTAIDGNTPVNTNSPADYFTVLNWHPYVAWLKSQHNEIYYAEIRNNRAYVNSNYAANWVAWNNGMYNIFVNQFTGYAPKVVFTELGISDLGTHVSSSNDIYRAVGGTDASRIAATIFSNILSAVDGLNFSNNCTIIGFRLCDTESIKAEAGDTGYHLYSEGNYGFIEENGTIKTIMKEYYYIINGTRDTDDLQAVVSTYYNN